MKTNAEKMRIEAEAQRRENWKRWGPYLSERQWGTVREDYSPSGDPWGYFTHDQARSRAYRWGEDGLLGLCDRQCRLCFGLALWNGKDPILKERLFGLTGPEGNHGEDVKENYYYLDAVPSYSYFKGLYKYPQNEFPYRRLIEENRSRNRAEPEFELQDTGVFEHNAYFDVFAEYAKVYPEDILIRITAANRGATSATLHLLGTLWFRNTWSWYTEGSKQLTQKPILSLADQKTITAAHPSLGNFLFYPEDRSAELLFTENETNIAQLFGGQNRSPWVKDAFHRYIVNGEQRAVNPNHTGTKAAAHYKLEIPAGNQVSICFRLVSSALAQSKPSVDISAIFDRRIAEATEFYNSILSHQQDPNHHNISRQAYAGLLWSKQFYHYIVKEWRDGDPIWPRAKSAQAKLPNHDWQQLYNQDIISMPDKWEYPWYAAWDLAFHMIPFSKIDPQFAKEQMVLLLREWYMHPSGKLPAYEFCFDDVNPPVHAWACWQVYKMTGEPGNRDRVFLSRCFQKLIINFTWWVNRKDLEGRNLFSGGFLGLDNIGVFDRSRPLPTGGILEQADATAWMAFYCATMLAIALELSRDNPATEDMASKFFEHFVAISEAMNSHGGTGLWDEVDGFYYDQLFVDNRTVPLRIRSLVGLIPLLAVELIDDELIEHLPGFKKRMEWFLQNRPELNQQISYCCLLEGGKGRCQRLLAIPSLKRLKKLLTYLLDENEFLSPFGIRSLSRTHLKNPYIFGINGEEYRVDYEPGESSTGLYGGNSNWRGPIWFPLNYLLIQALERYYDFYGDTLQVECPTGSGKMMNLKQVAHEISSRLAALFTPNQDGQSPWSGTELRYAKDPYWQNLTLFHEYFHAETGRGLGASHQTGWTALIANLLDK